MFPPKYLKRCQRTDGANQRVSRAQTPLHLVKVTMMPSTEAVDTGKNKEATMGWEAASSDPLEREDGERTETRTVPGRDVLFARGRRAMVFAVRSARCFVFCLWLGPVLGRHQKNLCKTSSESELLDLSVKQECRSTRKRWSTGNPGTTGLLHFASPPQQKLLERRRAGISGDVLSTLTRKNFCAALDHRSPLVKASSIFVFGRLPFAELCPVLNAKGL